MAERKLIGLEGRPRDIVESLSNSGFQVIVYGQADDPEVQGVLTRRGGISVVNPEEDIALHKRKIALLRQKSREQESFADFVSRFFAHNIGRIYELRVINDLSLDRADDSGRGAGNGGQGLTDGEGQMRQVSRRSRPSALGRNGG